MSRFIPYSRQLIEEDDIQSVVEVLRTDWITQGPRIEEFEKALAEYVGAQYAVACTSGTAALHLSCLALDLKKGGLLVTSPVTFLASANCAQFVGADTMFSDIDQDSWCLSMPMLEQLLRKKHVDVVVPVHFAGHSAAMEELQRLRNSYGFSIIEDACHALGGKYGHSTIGSCTYSDMAIFSFHPVKNITTGEGGAITTNCEKLYRRLLRFRTHGMHKESQFFLNTNMAFDENGDQNSWYYEMQEPGYNYRITDIQCALGISQLKKNERFVGKRRQIADIYNISFEDLPSVSVPLELIGTKHVFHLYTLLIDFDKLGKSRNQVMRELKALNIGSQVLYIPVYMQPYYRKKYGYRSGDFPCADAYYGSCLSIPIFPSMTDREINVVVEGVRAVLN